LPIPSPPPPLDKLVTPVSHQESIAPDDSSSGEGDAAAASDKPIAASPKKMPLTPQNHKTKISLPPKGKAGTGNTDASVTGFSSLVSIAGSTGLVLGIFLLLVWIVRRKTPQAMIRLPGEAFEVLGRAPLNGRQQVQLLRCGNRLLLVSVTPSGAETLTEITDPAEVDRLSGLCRQSQSGSSSAAFKQIFEQLAPRRPARNETMQYGFGDYETPAAGYPHSARGREDRNV
jgi:flagellar biogenesis protein FliO